MEKYSTIFDLNLLVDVCYPMGNKDARKKFKAEACTPVKKTLREITKAITFNKKLQLRSLHQKEGKFHVDFQSKTTRLPVVITLSLFCDADSVDELFEYLSLLQSIGSFVARQHLAVFLEVVVNEELLPPFQSTLGSRAKSIDR